jgi:hypothetical protein
LVELSHEEKVEAKIRAFLSKGIRSIQELSAEKLVDECAINPFLVKALGIRDFDSLARFYVYQRVGRSLVTSFGTTMEHMIRALSGGEKPTFRDPNTGRLVRWWDVKVNIQGRTYYMSVKSGPRDMDKDQVERFAQRARTILQIDPNAVPIIAMCYGRKPLGVISATLRDEGFDADKNTLTGQKLYQKLTGQPEYHKWLLDLTLEVALQMLEDKETVRMIDAKAKQIAEGFRKYGTLDKLLLETF